jgi:predicted  nucleic acid-binding Zn-ribbon protein
MTEYWAEYNMTDEDSPLTKEEGEVLRLLAKWKAQRFSLERLTRGSDLSIETVEKVLSSLEKRGLIEMKTTHGDTEIGKLSLEKNLATIQELLHRLSRLLERKQSTRTVVYDRVRTRLNDDLSRVVANLEFAVDRTREQLAQLTRELDEFKDRIDEAVLSADIGEISREDADLKIAEYREEIARLEVQRRKLLEKESGAKESDLAKQQRREKDVQWLRNLLDELEVRKRVGEFEGREDEFVTKRDQILSSLESLSGPQIQAGGLVEWTEELTRIGKVLADAEVFHRETLNRLTRARERVLEMSSSRDQAK